jgi:hypothetical protein
MTIALTPIETLPVSAASGLAAVGERFWTVADDETVLVGSGAKGDWTERIELVPDRLPEAHAARKRTKPDFEAIAVLPDGRLLVLGSGSTPARRRGVVVDLDTRRVRVVDLALLYVALGAQLAELNIEGAVVHGGAMFLAQRGNGDPGAGATNALVRLDLERILAGIGRGALEAEALVGIARVELPAIEGVGLTLTDLATDGQALCFSAAAENSASTYHDGACLGSAIGRLSVDGRVEALELLEGHEKIEGLAVVRTRAGAREAFVVADPDDRAKRARLFRVCEASDRGVSRPDHLPTDQNREA